MVLSCLGANSTGSCLSPGQRASGPTPSSQSSLPGTQLRREYHKSPRCSLLALTSAVSCHKKSEVPLWTLTPGSGECQPVLGGVSWAGQWGKTDNLFPLSFELHARLQNTTVVGHPWCFGSSFVLGTLWKLSVLCYLLVIICWFLTVAVPLVSKLLFFSLKSTGMHSLLVQRNWLNIEREAMHSRVFSFK